jgi:hypothetical protein
MWGKKKQKKRSEHQISFRRTGNLDDAESNIVFPNCVSFQRFTGTAHKHSINAIMSAEYHYIFHTKESLKFSKQNNFPLHETLSDLM